jgi:DNA-binding NarL/FixJ family response regulator
MKRILLADDNPGLRSALRLLLETRLQVELIVEARDMEHVLAQVEDARPDVIILDWELPGRPIRERVSVLRTLVPHLKVIAFSARPESKEAALAEGAEAFISKNDPPVLILDKIQKVCQPEAGIKNPCITK